MAVLQTCLCCSLLNGAIIIGVYTTVVYLVAFSTELWWVIEADVSLPVPAYILCAGYFIVFIISIFMLVGLSQRKTHYMLGWLFVMILFSFPEAGMVLFMSLAHWDIESNYGVVELSFWMCRVVLNIVGIVCVQSLYSMWRDEKTVMRRLQELNMAAVISDSTLVNGHLKMGRTLGYQNPGFMSSTPSVNGSVVQVTPVTCPGNLRRSASSASHLAMYSRNGAVTPLAIGGSYPINGLDPRLAAINALQVAYRDTKRSSEFDASNFNGMFAMRAQSELGIAGIGLSSSLYDGTTLQTYRPRSLLQIDDVDYWNRAPPTRPVSMGYVNQVHPEYTTQSLDRCKYLRNGPKRASSLDALNLRMMPDIMLQRLQHQPFNYLPAGSKSSLGAGSDDIHRYRDVAL